ncbi:m54R [Myxoma virus]|uniref:M54R n=2 Tax=Myxoma virus TaxID=10273 RepID=Q9Q8P2_MYXVL|nr:poxvirus myristoylprotein [Myxoma virus]AAF14942.1 m54R [Myxoma virus]AFU76986.1 m54R [Myxoma virus]AFU77153.1 m54R [Myxoma virus]AFU77318.1 m54R [Myxoma virus]AFU77486.1 m54R [Myxoma virus]
MGASFVVPENVKRAPPKHNTSEMALNVDHMYELISILNKGEELYLGKLTKEKKAVLEQRFPEFKFVESGPGSLFKAVRVSYKNDINYCCKDLQIHGYWIDKNGDISLFYRPNTVLNSCEPNMQSSGVCDTFMFKRCEDRLDTNACHDWISSMLNREDDIGARFVNNFVEKCSRDASTPLCETFLHNLRAKNTQPYDNLIDYLLMAQKDDFKSKYMRCSFPTKEKKEESLKYSETRECWDPECANANVNFLLTENYRNLGLCTINRCNVDINHLNITPRSKLRMTCGTEALYSPLPVNKEKVIKHNVDNSFQLHVYEITILFVLVIWILIVAI